MSTIEELIKNTQICDNLLFDLDCAAQHIDSYEYGLPLYSDSDKARLRETLYRWIIANFENIEIKK